MRRSWVSAALCLLGVGLVAVGCGHDIESPAVTAGTVTPDLVCAEQLTTPVKLTGSGFTPMPTQTLTSKTVLVLPSVTLNLTEDLTGSSVSPFSLAYSGDPAMPNSDLLLWSSEQAMQFTVNPGLTLQPGLYDVVVTNPDKKHSADFKDGLTVVPRPKLTAIQPDLLCDADGNQTVTITGTGLLQAGTALPTVQVGDAASGFTAMATAATNCTAVPGTHSEGAVQECTSITFTIPKGAINPGTSPVSYPVTVTNPPPADCHSTDTIVLTLAPPPSINTANALTICDAEGADQVTITGADFLEVGSALPTVQIGTQMFTPTSATGCTKVPGTFVEGTVQECTGLVITIPQGTFTPGMYPITITNPMPAACSSTQMVNLDVIPPPVVNGTTPGTLCAGGGTLTVSGSGFTSNATVSLVDPGMGNPTVTASSNMVDAAGDQIVSTFGGPLNVGTTYDVVVDDADGCTDQPPHKTISVVTGPIAFFADPDIVYSGINTQVTIYLTTLTGTATVTLTPAGMSSPVTNLTVVGVVPGKPNRLQVIIPSGLAAGQYDLHVTDATGCPTVLPAAITVTNTKTLALQSIVPPFGWNKTETPVTIFRNTSPPAGMTATFVATPRVFLNPSATQPAGNGCPALPTAIQVQSVSFVDMNTITAVVPKAQPTCLYDLIVVNPDQTVGVLQPAFTVQSAQPPVITSVTPSSIPNQSTTVTVTGTGFSGSTISVSCVDGAGNAITPAPGVTSGTLTCTAGVCSQPATINGAVIANGGVCVVRVTNADGSYYDYSAIGVTNPSGNLAGTNAASPLKVGRRALVASAGNATASARFVYAIGGDASAAAASAPFKSTELASVDIYGKMGSFQLQPASQLGTARSFAASATVGRYIYVLGGTSDGTNPLSSGERAIILSPLETPGLDIDDLVPAATGLDPGYWFYRVSATFSATDPDNPGGESLASDEFIVKVPSFAGKKIQVILKWSPPVDSLGVALPNVTGYNVYRTPAVNGASGGEVLLATVAAGTVTYTDDGTGTPGAQKPLPLGSTGKWAALPAMAKARMGAGGAAGFDPGNAADCTTASTLCKLYVYASLGMDTSTTVTTSYEYLTVTLQHNGHQTVGAWATGKNAVGSAGRWQLSDFVVDSTVLSSVSAGSTYVYFGAGIGAGTNGTAANAFDAGLIAAGGDLGTFTAVGGFSANRAGYAPISTSGQLIVFGGHNAAPDKSADKSALTATQPGNGSWSNEGLSLVQSRYLMGSAVQSGFLFILGGDTGGGVGSTTTETIFW